MAGKRAEKEKGTKNAPDHEDAENAAGDVIDEFFKSNKKMSPADKPLTPQEVTPEEVAANSKANEAGVQDAKATAEGTKEADPIQEQMDSLLQTKSEVKSDGATLAQEIRELGGEQGTTG